MNDAQMINRMARGWEGGRPFTECGNGTLPEYSEKARKWLPELALHYSIRTVNDAGAGDMRFTDRVKWRDIVQVRPFDLVPRLVQVQMLDITRDVMPAADAILCRMVLNHLDLPRVASALELFRRSAQYLIATQYDGSFENPSDEWTRYDLRHWLGHSLASVQDGADLDCRLAIWRL